MRSDALKKSQMNPKIVMMKKNERIDRNTKLHLQSTESEGPDSTYNQFRSTNPRMRKEAAQFLESLRDPFMRPLEQQVNNYDEIIEIKKSMSRTITAHSPAPNRKSAVTFASVPNERVASQMEQQIGDIEAKESVLTPSSKGGGYFSPQSNMSNRHFNQTANPYESPSVMQPNFKKEVLLLSTDGKTRRDDLTTLGGSSEMTYM